MYINDLKKQTNNFLEVDDSFATLIESSTVNGVDQAKFNFSFKISQLEALKQNAFSVKITIRKPSSINEPAIFPTRQGAVDFSNAKSIIDNILSHKIKISNVNKKKTLDVIATKVADISSKINNNLVSITKNVDLDATNLGFFGLRKTKLVVKNKRQKELSGNFQQPLKPEISSNVSQVFQNSAFKNSAKNLRLRLLSSGISPTDKTLFPNQTLSVYSKMAGVSSVEYKNANMIANQLLDLYLTENLTSDKADNLYEVVVDQVFNDKIMINTPIVLQDYLSLDPVLNVTFELIKTSTQNSRKEFFVLERVEKSFSLSKYFQSLSSSTSLATALAHDSRQVFITFKSNDTLLQEKNVEVYRKQLSADFKNGYEKIGVGFINDAGNSQMLSFPNAGDSIYRVIVENSSEFSDELLKSSRTNPLIKTVIIPALSSDGVSVSLQINNISELAGVRMLYRDVSKKEKNFLMTDAVLFDDKEEVKNLIDFTLSDLIPYHTYEFSAKLLFKNGIEIKSPESSLLEYVPFPAQINAEIVDEIVTENNVQFSIQTELLQDQIGQLNELLETVSAQYQQDLLLNRPAEFDRFLAFSITRYNLSRGDVEYLGIIKNNDLFVDSAKSSQVSAKPLTPGDSYRYIIYPLIREPEEVINEDVEAKDEETKKPYKLNPRKNRHPLTLIKGTVVTTTFINNDSKDDMLYGLVGPAIIFDASIDLQFPAITNVFLGQLDQKRLILSWNVSGDLSLIDHFIIAKEIDGVRTIIGKSHAFNDSLNFIYNLTNHDLGNVRFVIMTVNYDYSSGKNAVSNYVLIESLVDES